MFHLFFYSGVSKICQLYVGLPIRAFYFPDLPAQVNVFALSAYFFYNPAEFFVFLYLPGQSYFRKVILHHWGDLGVDGWIILGWISRRWDACIGTGLGWPRIETGGRRL